MRTTGTDARQGILDAAQRIMSRKGFAAVGLTEVLAEAGVPKGSFYHYFSSKEAFGEAMMVSYFDGYLADMDRMFTGSDRTAAELLMPYRQKWRDVQSADDGQAGCLAVKLGAEVADLSDPIRLALQRGIDAIVDRVERMITRGMADGSLPVEGSPRATAEVLYDTWLGASVRAKIQRDPAPLDRAMVIAGRLLHT